MTDEEFAQLLELKHEVFGVEFKPPGLRTDPLLFHTVARGLMGMANRRDGGRLVIGIREDAGKFELLGITPEQSESWRYEHLADALAPIAEPPVVFDIDVRTHQGREYLLIEVDEFDDVPVICRTNYPRSLKAGEKPILRDGAVYVRPRLDSLIGCSSQMSPVLLEGVPNVMGTVARAGARLVGGPSADQAFTDELPDDFR